MEKKAILIVSYVTNDFQRDLLKQSIESVLKYHSMDTLVVLNDNHEEPLEKLVPSLPNVIYELTKHPKSGEVNAFVWACEHVEKYSRFVFIHDSVVLHGTIPTGLTQGSHFQSLWYAVPYHASVGLMLPEVENVMKDIMIGPTNGVQLYNIILERYIYVVFGCMGVWDREFCRFIQEKTNILEHAGRFNTRNLRCLFERIVYICFAYLHHELQFRAFPALSLCGDIMGHQKHFLNTEVDSKLANNPYALKVWQGR
jgi:hypothetical protein